MIMYIYVTLVNFLCQCNVLKYLNKVHLYIRLVQKNNLFVFYFANLKKKLTYLSNNHNNSKDTNMFL